MYKVNNERTNKTMTAQKKTVQGVCPNCGSTELDYGTLELLDGELAYYPVTCNNCNCYFEATFEMKYIGTDNITV